MKKIIFTFCLLSVHAFSFAQGKLSKDLDGDNKMDTVYLDTEASVIICLLSTNKFQKVVSGKIDILNEKSGIGETRNGFVFWNNGMRAGYSNQFRFDKKTKKMQLIGMSRFELGNATNDGSGESSLNLLTKDYIGDWNYFDEDKKELIRIPTIKARMNFPYTSLEEFNDATYSNFAEKCSALYDRYKKALLK
ncbi:MAG TPA: hypothetical protein VM884_02610 [Flavisolibacter sp.]|jgi:hypothetical protein|nr:hypothetical protein [Flavisolibacter sp.]